MKLKIKPWLYIFTCTCLILSYQNCSHPYEELNVNALGSIEQKNLNNYDLLKNNPEKTLPWSSDDQSVQSQLFKALYLLLDQAGNNVSAIETESGYDLFVGDHSSEAMCSLNNGGSQGEQVSATVLTYSCLFSQSQYKSHELVSVASHLYHALKLHYKDQHATTLTVDRVIQIENGFMIQDDEYIFSCQNSSGYLCQISPHFEN